MTDPTAAELAYTGPTGPTRVGTAEAAALAVTLLGWINFPQVIHDSIGSAFDRSMDTHDQTCQGVADAILAELLTVAGEPAAVHPERAALAASKEALRPTCPGCEAGDHRWCVRDECGCHDAYHHPEPPLSHHAGCCGDPEAHLAPTPDPLLDVERLRRVLMFALGSISGSLLIIAVCMTLLVLR